MDDFATRRRMMVDTQVRPSDVTKFPIIDAMLAVPREVHVPPTLREAAYVGENVPLGPTGRVLLEPRSLAKLLDALNLQPADRVLVVGAGLGYSAAVVARIAGTVVAVEEDGALAADARRLLSGSVTVVAGPLAAGAPGQGPFDAILIEGGVEEVPATLTGQLADAGRIAAIFMQGALGTAQLGLAQDGHVSWRPIFNAAAPVLPGFARVRAFSL